jgi:hypothetical protein
VKRQDEEESSKRNVDLSNDSCCHGNQLEEREVIARAISPLVIELVVSFPGKCDQDGNNNNDDDAKTLVTDSLKEKLRLSH